MRRTHGTRQGTRRILKRSKSERGRVNISRIMHPYAEGNTLKEIYINMDSTVLHNFKSKYKRASEDQIEDL